MAINNRHIVIVQRTVVSSVEERYNICIYQRHSLFYMHIAVQSSKEVLFNFNELNHIEFLIR